MRERWPSPGGKEDDPSHEEGIEERMRALGPILDEMFTEKTRLTFQEINIRDEAGLRKKSPTTFPSLHGSEKGLSGWSRRRSSGSCLWSRQARAEDLAG